MFSVDPGFQENGKSIITFSEIDGRMLAKFAPRVLKSTVAFARSIAPPCIAAWKTVSGELESSSGIVSMPSLSVPVPGSTMSRLPEK